MATFLAEAYRYAYSRTVAYTAANIGGGQHPMYDFKLSGRGDIVLTKGSAQHASLSDEKRDTSKDKERDTSSAIG